MRILTRYLVARFFASFAGFLVVSIATIVIVEMMLNLGDMLGEESGLTGIATYLFLRIPSYYLKDLIPIVAFTAAFFTLGSASRWREIAAMKAGGLAPQRIAIPILLAGSLLMAANFVINETLVLRAARNWSALLGDRDHSTPITFRQGSFWYHRAGTIYNIDAADRETQTLRGVRIYELDGSGHLIRSIEARQAQIETNHRWKLDSPVIRTFGPDRNEAAPIIEHHQGEIELDLDAGADIALMGADLTKLALPDLLDAIERQPLSKYESARLRSLFHSRLAEPLAVLVLVLTAVPLGIQVERELGRSMLMPAAYGIATIAAFFSLRSLGGTLTAAALLPPEPFPWFVLALFFGFGAWRYVRMPS